MEIQRDLLSLGPRFERHHRPAQKLDHIIPGHLQFHRARFQVGQIEKLVDEYVQSLCVVLDEMEFLTRRRFLSRFNRLFSRSKHQSKRRPEFVGNVREETGLHAVDLGKMFRLEVLHLRAILQSCLVQPHPVDGDEKRGPEEKVKAIGPERSPPRWRYAEGACDFPFRPFPPGRRRPHTECVVARTECGVTDIPAIQRFDPVRFEAFQSVFVFYKLRGIDVYRRKHELEDILVVREMKRAGTRRHPAGGSVAYRSREAA